MQSVNCSAWNGMRQICWIYKIDVNDRTNGGGEDKIDIHSKLHRKPRSQATQQLSSNRSSLTSMADSWEEAELRKEGGGGGGGRGEWEGVEVSPFRPDQHILFLVRSRRNRQEQKGNFARICHSHLTAAVRSCWRNSHSPDRAAPCRQNSTVLPRKELCGN